MSRLTPRCDRANGRGRRKQGGWLQCCSVGVAAFSLNSAFGQVATSVSLRENGAGENRLDVDPSLASTKRSREEPPSGGNPLWGVPIDKLTATRERPLFTASRRPPAPPVAPEPPAEPPPPPAEPERPQLTLVGTVTGEQQKVAVVQTKPQKVSFVFMSGRRFPGGFCVRSMREE